MYDEHSGPLPLPPEEGGKRCRGQFENPSIGPRRVAGLPDERCHMNRQAPTVTDDDPIAPALSGGGFPALSIHLSLTAPQDYAPPRDFLI